MGTPIPVNHARLSLDEIVGATGGALVADSGATGVVGVSTDTRELPRGAAFVALSGERFDGHQHLDAAAAAGARVVIVERDVTAPPGLAVIRVPSTLVALGDLARFHARRWRAIGGPRRVVAITGSAGKTTTRVAAQALLEALAPGQVLATTGNLNNRVGLPLTVLGLDEEHRVAVLEVGTSLPGEIALLAAIAEPDVAVLTLVAEAHVAALGSLDGVQAEKGALLRALPEGAVAIANGDDARASAELAASPARRRVRYGFAPGLDVVIAARRPEGLSAARLTVTRAAGTVSFVTPLLGEAGALATAAALAVADAVGADLGAPPLVDGARLESVFARAEVGGGGGRLVPRLLADGLALVDDSYNANPASTRASIRAARELAAATGRRLVLVLGEMRELGVASDEGHDAVGIAAAESGAGAIVAVAGAARRIADAARAAGAPVTFADDVAAAARDVLEIVRPTDLVLVKGSRGVATERVVRALVAAHDGTPTPVRAGRAP